MMAHGLEQSEKRGEPPTVSYPSWPWS